MRRIVAATVALFAFSHVGAASAAESSMLAIKAGFLLGHAQRCGVAPARVDRIARVLRRAIAADSRDSHEKELSGSRFDLVFVASAYPDTKSTELVPSCRAVVAEFERLERHQRNVSVSVD